MARFSGFLAALLPLLASGIQLEFSINSQNGVLPNPSKLPSSSNAVLSSLGPPLVAPITASNTFLFSSVPAGSYLLSVYSRDALFEDLRVDVTKNETGEAASSWTTFRGNEWDNKGELRGSGEGRSVQIEVRPLVSKDYYQERSTFSVISIFKSPMILIAIFSLVMVVGMPYLMENLDPEVKAELEDMQKNQKGMASSATNLQNMDIASDFASWMAGSKPTDQKTKK